MRLLPAILILVGGCSRADLECRPESAASRMSGAFWERSRDGAIGGEVPQCIVMSGKEISVDMGLSQLFVTIHGEIKNGLFAPVNDAGGYVSDMELSIIGARPDVVSNTSACLTSTSGTCVWVGPVDLNVSYSCRPATTHKTFCYPRR